MTTTRQLHHGDCLDVLRQRIPDACVDLVYLDPPFNTGVERRLRDRGFADVWRWDATVEGELAELAEPTAAPGVAGLVRLVRDELGDDALAAYLVGLGRRLVEVRRVLKPAGSVYLHCDPTASHYLKVLLDTVLGKEKFQREIVWRVGWVSGFKSRARNWVRNHDVLLYYAGPGFTFNKEYLAYPPGYRRRDGAIPSGPGVPLEDTWNCHPADELNSIMIMSFSREKLGYPTQKPRALLERIIRASSNPGDVVLDPYCGSGTTPAAAEALGRGWIGVDANPAALELTERRLREEFPELEFDLECGKRT
ncbi:MAG: site-specific DNA-methyltransferase [Candidatus Coatesbacteria bacterium]|nr:site-specific DNA-methyltransferase [Candidatus Coatesbacteria bacterium]